MPNNREKDYATLVESDEKSQLKSDLNRGIFSLSEAIESHFRPHICINGIDGVEVIKKIAENPDSANTTIFLYTQLDYDCGRSIWLNIAFAVYLNNLNSDSMPPLNPRVFLSPRQTGYIIKNLPPESKSIVLEKTKIWYFKEFLEKIKEGLEKISKQFEEKKELAETTSNKIFDIHGNLESHDSVPYTEWDIVGRELFGKFFHGHSLFHYYLDKQDGYDRIDKMLLVMDKEREEAASTFMNCLKSLRL